MSVPLSADGEPSKPSALRTVVTVCTGNTCRSPMAAAWLADRLVAKGWQVESAGLAACNGDAASPEAVEVMRELGLNLHGHRSRRLTAKTVAAADVLLVMTYGHLRELRMRFPEAAEKTFLAGEFVPGAACEIPDPYGGSLEDYRRTREALVRVLGDFLLWLHSKGWLAG